MDESAFKAWESFYVIVGSTAGALTGLQFVVLTLISEAGMIRGTRDTLSAFGSPNVVHFCASLLVAAVMSAPWHGLGAPGVALALCGLFGLIYSATVLKRARRQSDYTPVLEDWIWHTALPLLAYAALLLAGIEVSRLPEVALDVVGGAVLLLVFIGIHNAWDTVTYVTMERARELSEREAAERARAPVAPPENPGPSHPPVPRSEAP